MTEALDGIAKIMTIIMPVLLLFAGYWIAEGQKRNAADIIRQNERNSEELKLMAGQANKNAEDAATEARMVSRTLATTNAENAANNVAINKVLSETAEVTKSTHILVNNNMEIQLALNYELSSWKAEREPNTANKAAMERARKLLEDHRKGQAESDAQVPRENFGVMPEGVTVKHLEEEAIEQIIEAAAPSISQMVDDATPTIEEVADAVEEKHK